MRAYVCFERQSVPLTHVTGKLLTLIEVSLEVHLQTADRTNDSQSTQNAI